MNAMKWFNFFPPYKAAASFVDAAASINHGSSAAAGRDADVRLWDETKGRCRVVRQHI